jgi:hypothetical protein
MRDAPLTVLKGGINRLRTRGGARADSLYDLLNGYLTDDGTARARPGTVRVATLDEATKGLAYFDGSRHTFASEVVTVPDGYTLHVLVHPDATVAAPIAIDRIHFAEPFMGFLYVVAEFENGDVYHYWLQSGGGWTASTVYKNGDVVEPTTPNGLSYQATRLGQPNPSWQPSTARAEGDIVEPTVYNDFYYTVVEAVGSNPVSGTVEPDWPEEDGARVTEETGGTADSGTVTTPPTTQTPSEETRDRYDKGGSSSA